MVAITDKQNALEKATPEQKDKQLWRDLVAFWILGLCNNFGYVVMLSAAHDIIARFDETTEVSDPKAEVLERQCNIVSTGAILLADVIPGFVVKLVMPFLPFWINTRVASAVALSVAGFLCVGFAEVEMVALLGVVCTSAACGMGESSILPYTSNYNRNSLSTWSSGTGGAGVIGALAYAGLCAINVSSRNIMLIMLIFPVLECIAFWIILRKPSGLVDNSVPSVTSVVEDDKPLQGWKEQLMYITSLFKYMLPLLFVYFFEYFINQGLFELVNFENTFLDKESQYRWLCVDYQIGVFISRSSVNLIKFKHIWILSLLQFINVAYFLTEVIFFYTPSIWIAFAIVLWEGLLGGGAYVNTFYRMSSEVPRSRQEFAIAVTVQADSLGIMLSGFLAMPVHNAICRLPAHPKLFS
ncbi:battenin-like [Episyrphus balteatus]|uniref:battenin-like n=1 Tax=Episyrphus balteatus TaxID=286459 RepID=UPI0024861E40|nr:battenin-like [Episyrphus balteatus]